MGGFPWCRPHDFAGCPRTYLCVDMTIIWAATFSISCIDEFIIRFLPLEDVSFESILMVSWTERLDAVLDWKVFGGTLSNNSIQLYPLWMILQQLTIQLDTRTWLNIVSAGHVIVVSNKPRSVASTAWSPWSGRLGAMNMPRLTVSRLFCGEHSFAHINMPKAKKMIHSIVSSAFAVDR